MDPLGCAQSGVGIFLTEAHTVISSSPTYYFLINKIINSLSMSILEQYFNSAPYITKKGQKRKETNK